MPASPNSLPQFLLNHGRDNPHYESHCGSTGNNPFLLHIAVQSVLQIDMEVECLCCLCYLDVELQDSHRSTRSVLEYLQNTAKSCVCLQMIF